MLKYFSLVFLFAISTPTYALQTKKIYDVVAIGESMVDLVRFDKKENFVNLLNKEIRIGDTTRITDKEADLIQNKLKDFKIIPGGSEANIIVNIASLGGKTAFNTVLANDEMGVLFKESLLKHGVDFSSPFTEDKNFKTARCFTFITPDKERTFIVSSEISSIMSEKYVDYEKIAKAKIFFTDASNLGSGPAKDKMLKKAFTIAKQNSTLIAFNLNNQFFVEKNRKDILKLIPDVDLLIGSENEMLNLLEINEVTKAAKKLNNLVNIAIITRGEKGAMIIYEGNIFNINSYTKTSKIIDLNGAGDGFAGGFLYGYTHGLDVYDSGILGSKTAAQIIYQVGARPLENLSKMVMK